MPDCHLPDSRLSQFDSIKTQPLRQILGKNGKNPHQNSQMENTLSITERLAPGEKEGEISPEAPRKEYPGGKRKRPGIPGLIAVAAALVILVGFASTAKGLWESIIHWSENTFSLFLPEDSDIQDKPPLAMDDVPEDFQEVSGLLPTWFPADYTHEESSVQQTPAARIYQAFFSGPRGSIRIRIGDYLSENPTQYEYSQGLQEIYQADGIQYYICNNYDLLTAVWLSDRRECSISGNVTLEEMKQMIDSIGG